MSLSNGAKGFNLAAGGETTPPAAGEAFPDVGWNGVDVNDVERADGEGEGAVEEVNLICPNPDPLELSASNPKTCHVLPPLDPTPPLAN
jgi:hypothetical protein